jgi:hypothetical protein
MENNRIEKQFTVYKSGEEEFTKNAERWHDTVNRPHPLLSSVLSSIHKICLLIPLACFYLFYSSSVFQNVTDM